MQIMVGLSFLPSSRQTTSRTTRKKEVCERESSGPTCYSSPPLHHWGVTKSSSTMKEKVNVRICSFSFRNFWLHNWYWSRTNAAWALLLSHVSSVDSIARKSMRCLHSNPSWSSHPSNIRHDNQMLNGPISFKKVFFSSRLRAGWCHGPVSIQSGGFAVSIKTLLWSKPLTTREVKH